MTFGAFIRFCLVSLAVCGAAGAALAVGPSSTKLREPPQLAAALTDGAIAVTSEFKGARVTIFGAVRSDPGSDLVVAVRGPSRAVAVFHQERVALFWLPRKPVRFNDAPGYFAVASERPLKDIAKARDLAAYGLNPAGSAPISQSRAPLRDLESYRAALARLMADEGLYSVNPSGLKRLPDGLFRADIEIPARAPVGDYVAETYLFRHGKLLSRRTSPLHIDRAGMERFVHSAAHTRPFSYALACLGLAIGAGWAAARLIGRQ
jgi:uncharacterized protein (TIGR02186 family)